MLLRKNKCPFLMFYLCAGSQTRSLQNQHHDSNFVLMLIARMKFIVSF